MSSIMSTDPRRSIGKLDGVICGSPGASDLSARMCAKTHFDSSPCRASPTDFSVRSVSLVQGPRGHLGLSGAENSESNEQGAGRQRAPRAAEFVSKIPKPQAAASTPTKVKNRRGTVGKRLTSSLRWCQRAHTITADDPVGSVHDRLLITRDRINCVECRCRNLCNNLTR